MQKFVALNPDYALHVVVVENVRHKLDHVIRELQRAARGTLDPAAAFKQPAQVPLPPIPQLPKHQWLWNSAPDKSKPVFTPYDYDQCVVLDDAYQRGDQSVTISGDINGVQSDSVHKPPGASNAVYQVDLTRMRQINVVSKYEREVKRVPLKPGDKPPPLFEEAVQRAKAARQAMQAPAAAAPATPSAPAAVRVSEQDLQVTIHGQASVVRDQAAKLAQTLQSSYKSKPLRQKATSKTIAERVLQLPAVQAAMEKGGISVDTLADGTFSLRYLQGGGIKVLQAAIVEGLLNETLADRAQHPGTWTAPDGSAWVSDPDGGHQLVDVHPDTPEFATACSSSARAASPARCGACSACKTSPCGTRTPTSCSVCASATRMRTSGSWCTAPTPPIPPSLCRTALTFGLLKKTKRRRS